MRLARPKIISGRSPDLLLPLSRVPPSGPPGAPSHAMYRAAVRGAVPTMPGGSKYMRHPNNGLGPPPEIIAIPHYFK